MKDENWKDDGELVTRGPIVHEKHYARRPGATVVPLLDERPRKSSVHHLST